MMRSNGIRLAAQSLPSGGGVESPTYSFAFPNDTAERVIQSLGDPKFSCLDWIQWDLADKKRYIISVALGIPMSDPRTIPRRGSPEDEHAGLIAGSVDRHCYSLEGLVEGKQIDESLAKVFDEYIAPPTYEDPGAIEFELAKEQAFPDPIYDPTAGQFSWATDQLYYKGAGQAALPAPDFTSGRADAAWWRTRVNGVAYRCYTSGNTFVRLLQDKLRARLTSTGASYDGHNVVGSQVASDARWGPTTQRALWLVLRNLQAPQVLLDAVRADGQAHTLRVGSIAAAIWLFHRDGYDEVPPGLAGADIVVEPNTVPPRWSVAPAVTEIPPTGVFCDPIGVEGRYEEPAQSGSQPDPDPGAPTPGQSTGGGTPPPDTRPVVQRDASPPPGVSLPLPPGITVPGALQAPSGVNWWLVGGVAAAVGVVALVVSQTGRS